MTEKELQKYLKSKFPKEDITCDWKEFKSLKNLVAGSKGSDIVSYISGISNMEGGHLVLGIEDGTHKIKGIKDFAGFSIDNIKSRLIGNLRDINSEELYVEEFVTSDSGLTVWVINIPKHYPRRPVYAHNTKYQRIDDSLMDMTHSRFEAILRESLPEEKDWFAETVENVKPSDLDAQALKKAKAEYKKNHPKLASQVDGWPTVTFLKKAFLTFDGKLTRAAILLLGTKELLMKLPPIVARISFDSRDRDGTSNTASSGHIYPPFILAADRFLELISNKPVSQMPEDSVFPEKIQQFDNWVIREALHNCIAHQDYTKKERIVIVEHPDYILFENSGNFIPGSIEKVIEQDAPQREYRNPFLCEAMTELNMIDTVGSGIKKMFTIQRERFFPLPDFDLTQQNTTRVKIYNKEINSDFTNILRTKKELKLKDIILLDKVQKRHSLKQSEAIYLKNLNLIAGKKPNYILISSGKFVITPGQNDLMYDEFKNKLLLFIKKYGKATRADIENLFMPMLSDNLTIEKKKKKLTNMIHRLSKDDASIKNDSDSTKFPVWVLV